MEKSNIRILIIDDEADILNALQTHLEMDGYTIDIADSAGTALEKITTQKFHIVLTDINMPKMDGAADYILKPFRDLSEVDKVIERAYEHIQRWDNVLTETRRQKKQKVS